MTLKELYEKIPVAKHAKIQVVGNTVIYDTGTKILTALIDSDGQLVPANAETRDALNALG